MNVGRNSHIDTMLQARQRERGPFDVSRNSCEVLHVSRNSGFCCNKKVDVR